MNLPSEYAIYQKTRMPVEYLAYIRAYIKKNLICCYTFLNKDFKLFLFLFLSHEYS